MIEGGWALPVRLRAVAMATAFSASIAACSVPTETPELVTVSPAQAYSDVPMVLRVETKHLRPAFRVSAQNGTLASDLGSMRMRLVPQGADLSPAPLEVLGWNNVDVYWLGVPAGIPPASYALQLTDPRGATVSLPNAFTGLGPDPAPPAIEVVLPEGDTFGSGRDVTAKLVVNDEPGFLAHVGWKALDNETVDCFDAPPLDQLPDPPAPISRTECLVTFTAPILSDANPTIMPMPLRVVARDLAGNESGKQILLRVAKRPIVDGFAGPVGALGGRQPFTVRGRFFIPGSTAIIGGVPLIGGTLTEHLDGTATISGWTPPRSRAEPVWVEVWSGAGKARSDLPFFYMSAPVPRDIQPAGGPTGGAFRVTVRGNDLRPGFVSLYLGATREVRQPLYKVSYDQEKKVVIGCVPPGSGTVSLWAYDPVTGDGEMPMAFKYQDPPAGDTPPPPDPACALK